VRSPWSRRPIEERAHLNPVFVALVLRKGAHGYVRETRSGLPFVLTFLLVPLALHPATRRELPRAVSTSLPGWIQAHPILRQTFADRVRSVAPAVREGTLIGLKTGFLSISEGGRLLPEAIPRRAPGFRQTLDSADCIKRGEFVGRWFGRTGDPGTIYALWGIRP
jgi:hypothetical protein